MVNLYVVYGSETQLLKDLYSFDNSFFIRIFNNRIPVKMVNAVDVSDFEQFKKVFDQQVKSLSPQRIIFIGAAFLVQNNLFLHETKEIIDKALDTNVLKYVEYCHFLLPYMRKIKSGNFIYLSSFRAITNARGISLYSAAKAFGEKFFEVIGKENGSFGVYSTSIRLGCFDGRMIKVLGDEKIKQLVLSIGNRKLGSSNDLIETIKFILSNNYTNGGVIDLTGGISF